MPFIYYWLIFCLHNKRRKWILFMFTYVDYSSLIKFNCFPPSRNISCVRICKFSHCSSVFIEPQNLSLRIGIVTKMKFIQLICLLFVFVFIDTFCFAADRGHKENHGNHNDEGDFDVTDFHCQPIRDEKQNPKHMHFPTTNVKSTIDEIAASIWWFFG